MTDVNLITFVNSKESLDIIQSTIICIQCKDISSTAQLRVLKTCGHTFCKLCLSNKVMKCPVCEVVYQRKDIKICTEVQKSKEFIDKLRLLFETPINISQEETNTSYTKTVECLAKFTRSPALHVDEARKKDLVVPVDAAASTSTSLVHTRVESAAAGEIDDKDDNEIDDKDDNQIDDKENNNNCEDGSVSEIRRLEESLSTGDLFTLPSASCKRINNNNNNNNGGGGISNDPCTSNDLEDVPTMRERPAHRPSLAKKQTPRRKAARRSTGPGLPGRGTTTARENVDRENGGDHQVDGGDSSPNRKSPRLALTNKAVNRSERLEGKLGGARTANKRRQSHGVVDETPKKVGNKQTKTPAKEVKKAVRKKSHMSKLESRNRKGETPLHVACIKGNVNLVNKLIEEGANTNTCDYSKWTPLHEACQQGFADIVQALLLAGALVDAPGHDNVTPLHDAVKNGNLDCAKHLMSYGADVAARNRMGETPISIAPNESILKVLKKPANLNNSSISVASNTQREPPKPKHFTILLTGVSSAKRKCIERVSSVINSTFTNNFSDQVTHIVSMVNEEGKCPRTEKYLKGILTGKWILRLDWLEDCMSAGKRLDEQQYEIVSAVSNCKSRQYVDIPRRGRLYSTQHKPPLFEGCSFFLKYSFNKECTRDIVENIITIGGGCLLKRQPKAGHCLAGTPFHSVADGELTRCATYVIVGSRSIAAHDNEHDTATTSGEDKRAAVVVEQEEEEEQIVGMRGDTLCQANVAWLLECVASLQLIDPTEYTRDAP